MNKKCNGNYKQKSFLVTIVALILFIFAIAPSSIGAFFFVSPANAQTTQITNNDFDDDLPQINDGKIVWQSTDYLTHNDIYIYDDADNTTTKITQTNRNQTPKIDAGQVVWPGYDGNDDEIFLYDSTTGITTQITNNNSNDISPQINAGKVVWESSDGTSASDEIFLYDSTTGITTQITHNEYVDAHPQINNGQIVWFGFDGTDDEIFLYDTTTGITTQITHNEFDDGIGGPQINAGKVVWASANDIDNEIFLYDSTDGNITQITNDDFIDSSPQIDDGKVVWESQGAGRGSRKVYLHDITTNNTIQISGDIVNSRSPQINNGKIVWSGFDGNDAEIFLYDSTTGDTTQITNNDFDDSNPQINAGKVVWAGSDGNDNEIYLWEGLAPNFDTPVGSNVGYSENGVELTFSQVTSAGNTSITISSTGNKPPAGFRLGNPPTYYNISTTAIFTGNIEVCIDYSSLNINANENNFKLMHFEPNAGWVNITASLDTINNIICGNTASFSDFAVMAAPTIPDLISKVQEMNLHQGIENSLDAKLTSAQEALNANNSGQQATAVNKLNAFINEVEAQRGNKITNDQADELHRFASNIIRLIQGETLF